MLEKLVRALVSTRSRTLLDENLNLAAFAALPRYYSESSAAPAAGQRGDSARRIRASRSENAEPAHAQAQTSEITLTTMPLS
jgi:hypothetical protein